MNSDENASLTPDGRAHLVQEIDRIGPMAAARAAGHDLRMARKWFDRYANEAAAGRGRRRDRAARGR